MKIHFGANRTAWTICGLGVALQVSSVLIWMVMVGPSWWEAYRHGRTLGALANHIEYSVFGIGSILCVLAPFLAAIPLRQKFALSALCAVAAGVMWFLSGLLVILVYGL
jgi:hypothetical protein